MSKYSALALSLLFIVASCTDNETATGPAAPANLDLLITGLPDTLFAPTDYSRSLPFEVLVQDGAGNPAADVTVTLALTGATGAIELAQPVTDQFGRVTAVCRLTIPNEDALVAVSALANGYAATARIQVVSTPRPELLQLAADHPEIRVNHGQNAEIKLTAVVTDLIGRPVPALPLTFELMPVNVGEQIYGSLGAAPPTDANGQTSVLFNSRGGSGNLVVRASYADAVNLPDGITDEVGIDVSLLTHEIVSLEVSADPTILRVPPDSIAESVITAQVKDSDGRGVSKVLLDFRTDLGILGSPSLTDDFGVARAVFKTNGEYGDATVTVSVPGTDLGSTVTITVVNPAAGANLQLYTDVSEIYADNGHTVAHLTASLKNEDNQVMAGEDIAFSSDFGAVYPANVITDESGIARAIFTDLGEPSEDENGNPIPAFVTARYQKGGVEASVEIFILARNPISVIDLYAQAVQMTAGSGDSTLISAFCIQENGQRAPDSTEVHFRASIGRCDPDVVHVSGGSGRAETHFFAPGRTGRATLMAYVVNADGDTVKSNGCVITILPGLPSRISVTSDRASLVTNDPNEFATITATVQDTLGNPIRPNTYVYFTTTLGTITPSAVLDTTGRASARLYAGAVAGFATVTASVNRAGRSISDEVTVQFIAGSPNSIELSAYPLTIQARGTGGLESSTLTARVFDPNGNLVTVNTIVYFELIRQPPEPEGCNFNNHGQLDSAFTANGVATAMLTSGTRSGPVLVKAYTWRDPETRLQLVSVTNSNVQVVAGYPALIDIDINDDGIDVDGAFWALEMAVRLYDEYRNPVGPYFHVAFSLDPPVEGVGFTREVNGRQGYWLTYSSSNTFDSVNIVARIELADTVITEELPYVLPLQRGELSLNVSPTNWMFVRPPAGEEGDPCLIRCWAVLTDGHGVLINNAPILFTTNRATFWRRDIRGTYREYVPPDPAKKFTGWRAPKHPDYNEEDGIATVYLRGTMDDFFLDIFTLEITVTIGAGVVGYEDVYARPETVTMTRH
jgi:hypothetical protein